MPMPFSLIHRKLGISTAFGLLPVLVSAHLVCVAHVTALLAVELPTPELGRLKMPFGGHF